jgi:hypothetical protein
VITHPPLQWLASLPLLILLHRGRLRVYSSFGEDGFIMLDFNFESAMDDFVDTDGLLRLLHGQFHHHRGLHRQSLGAGRLATLLCCCVLLFDGPYLEDA